MKKLAKIILLTVIFVSCGKVESPQEFFDITGDKGKGGQNCYAERVIGGVNIICGGSVEFVADGTDGINGENGSFEGYIEYQEVCPQYEGEYKETLMFLNGEFLAYMASNKWNEQRLVVLPENVRFKTTDGRDVYFTIVNGEILCE